MAQEIENLIRLAEQALNDSSPREELIQRIEAYLQALESWQKKVESGPPLSDGSRGEVENLNAVHQRLLLKAKSARDSVMSEMGENKKRTTAMKAYIDRFPKRITIAGRRKG